MKITRFEDFENEAAHFPQILENYKKANKPFIDKSFHPNAKIPETAVDFNKKEYKWARMDEFYQAPLFKKNLIKPEYISIGLTSGGYTAALCCIANNPDAVKSLFDTETPDRILGAVEDSINLKCGAVVIKLFAFGREVHVLIDTMLPFKRGTIFAVFSHPSDLKFSPWICLVEKAYAKLLGSFSALENWKFGVSLYNFFGYSFKSFPLKDLQTPEKLQKRTPYENFLKYQSEGTVVCAFIYRSYIENVSADDINSKGLQLGYPYLIQKVIKVDDKEFIGLRNPWTRNEWIGDWSDTSDLWTEELKKKVGLKLSNDGMFYMISNDFFKYFNYVEVSKALANNYHCRTGQFTNLANSSREINDVIRGSPDERNSFGISIIDPSSIPDSHKVKLNVLIERHNSSGKYDSKYKYVLLEKFQNGSTQWITYTSSNRFNFFSHIFTSNDSSLSIIYHRCEPNDNSLEDVYITCYSKHDFELYDEKNSNQKIPENNYIYQKQRNAIFDFNRGKNPAGRRNKAEEVDRMRRQMEEMQQKLLEKENDIKNEENDHILAMQKKREEIEQHQRIAEEERRRQQAELEEKRKQIQQQNMDIQMKKNLIKSKEEEALRKRKQIQQMRYDEYSTTTQYEDSEEIPYINEQNQFNNDQVTIEQPALSNDLSESHVVDQQIKSKCCLLL